MKLSCIIIEDEPLATEKLENFISRTPELSLQASFENAIDGIQYLKGNDPDIVFLDIQMEHLTGIQMLETFEVKPYVIITSAYAEYALKGYELSVFDYLLKPYGYDRFLNAINKVVSDAEKKQIEKKGCKSNLFVKTEHRLENVFVNDILYIEGMKEYLRIVLPDRKIMTKTSFKSILEELPSDKFIQVHKSWVVQVNKIDSIERSRIYINDTIIPIGKSFKDGFNRMLNEL